MIREVYRILEAEFMALFFSSELSIKYFHESLTLFLVGVGVLASDIEPASVVQMLNNQITSKLSFFRNTSW